MPSRSTGGLLVMAGALRGNWSKVKFQASPTLYAWIVFSTFGLYMSRRSMVTAVSSTQ